MLCLNIFKMRGSLVDQLNQYAIMSYIEQTQGMPCCVEGTEPGMLEEIFHIKLNRLPEKCVTDVEYVYCSETEITEAHFRRIEDQIRESLIFLPIKYTMEEDTINRLYYDLILSLADSVGVHISKREAVRKAENVFFERYRRVILGRKKNEDTTFFVFSDDIEWCKAHEFELGLGEGDGDVFFVEENHSREKEYIDMQLLGCCRTVIASHGCFVDWALRLGTQENIQFIDVFAENAGELVETVIQQKEQWDLTGKEKILERMNEMHSLLTACLHDLGTLHEMELNNPEIMSIFQELKDFDIAHKTVLKMPAFWKQIASVEASLENIKRLCGGRTAYAYRKLQYECIPMLENMRMDFYFHAWVRPCRDKEQKRKFYNELYGYFSNPYIERARQTGEYKYDMTIFVMAYNELDYTKQCMEYLLKNIPSNIKYELILMNHGSSDGTREYFESLHPDKQIDIAVNGGGSNLILRISEGRYWLAVTNDLLVMPNAIENMYKCICSDDKIAYVVATTPNIGNQQTISLDADSLDRIEELARKNNVSDPMRWDEKVRLFNPISLVNATIKLDCFYGKDNIFGYPDFGWPDHKQSMMYRQSGYKNILAKDAYCYHYGQVTLKKERRSEENAQKIFKKTRIKWLKEWSYDPSGYGQIWDEALFGKLVIKNSPEYNILGINSGMGENLLKFKNLIKENSGSIVKKVWLNSVTQFKMNIPDLDRISDEMIFDRYLECFGREPKRKYDYILLENVSRDMDIGLIGKILLFKKEDGILLIRVNDDMQLRDCLVEQYGAKFFAEGKLGVWVSI